MTDHPYVIDSNGRTRGPRELSSAWLRPRAYAPADVTFTVNGTLLEGDRYTFELAMGDPDQRRYPGDGNRHERRKAAAERRRRR